MKILFFGSDDFACPSLKALASSPHKVLAVITQPDRPAGRGQKLTPCPAAMLAKNLNLKLIQPTKIQNEEATQQLLVLKPDILVVVAYGKFLPKRLINGAPFKALNLHPSLLPKYRGAAPMEWALLNGEKKTGVTTMTITEEMDAGDIYLQSQIEITENENAESLRKKLSELGADLLLKTLDGLEKESLKAKPQDPKKVSFAPKLEKKDGHLSWQEPATALYNKVRALNPWPGTYCFWDEKRLKVTKASIVKKGNSFKPGIVCNLEGGIVVACGQGSLSLLEVQLEGKNKMSAAEFLKGHSLKLGTLLK